MLVSKQLLTYLKRVVPLGFNEVNISKSNSILIYTDKTQTIYRRNNVIMPKINKGKLKVKFENEGVGKAS